MILKSCTRDKTGRVFRSYKFPLCTGNNFGEKAARRKRTLYTISFDNCMPYMDEEQTCASEATGGKTQTKTNEKMDLGGNGPPNDRTQSIWRGRPTATGAPKRIFRQN